MKYWVLVYLFAVVFAKHEHYAGWKSYFVTPATREQLAVLVSLENKLSVDFYVRPIVGRDGLALVKPQYQEEFLKAITTEGINHRVHAEDVKSQLDIDDQRIEARHEQFRSTNTTEKPYDNYLRLDEIYKYMDDVAANYPNIVTMVTPGKSFEGRPIKYLKISSSNFQNSSKTLIFIEATIHAREWIAPPVATYSIHKLVENLTDPELLENFDWIILPVSNPDGYEFAHTDQRFWRKTRSTDQAPESKICPGVDGNRNYDFFWGTADTDTDPCSITYGGSQAFSEIETRIVRDIIKEHLNRMAIYISLHSSGSMVLYPWSHDGTLSNNAFGLHTVGVSIANAIDKNSLPYFQRYTVGNLKLVLQYGVTGGSIDYAHSNGVPLTYVFELPGLPQYQQGFNLDPKYARQISEETWEGIAVGAKRTREIINKH